MEISFKKVSDSIRNADRKTRIILAVALLGILLILLSEFIPKTQSADSKKNDSQYGDYISTLEKKTESLVSDIQGVGRCKVMITLESADESIFARNTKENQSDSSYSKDDEYVFYEGENGKAPVLIKQYFPAVQGVAVVCDGADNTAVRESVINSISSLYGISVSKISVSKYKG